MADAHNPKPSLEAKTVNTVSNILAIVGFVILIVIVVWGLLHIATLSSGWFSSLFGTSKSTSALTVSAPESTISGQPMRLTWKYSTSDTGRYAFLYECTDGLEFGIPVLPPGETKPVLSRVPCGATFTLGNATSSVVLVPILSTTTPQTARMTMLFVPTGNGTTVQGSAKMTVTPNTNSSQQPATSTPVATSTKPTPTATPTPSPKPSSNPTPAPRPAGPADLKVTLLSVTTDASGLTVASFDIGNIGGSSSGTYYFTAQLPTSQPYTFASQPQNPLGPGDHIVNTLRFTQTVTGLFSVTVSGDSNANNNSDSQMIYAPYTNSYQPVYQTYQTQTYPQYQYTY